MKILLAYQNNLCRSFLRDTLSDSEILLTIQVASTVREICQYIAEG